jgi:hypothetical protein
MSSGKGSKPRPFSVSNEEYNSRWDAIFARDNPKQPKLDSAEEILIPPPLPNEKEE